MLGKQLGAYAIFVAVKGFAWQQCCQVHNLPPVAVTVSSDKGDGIGFKQLLVSLCTTEPIGVLEAIGVCSQVHRLGQFEIIAVVNAAKIPGHVINGYPASGQTSRYLEGLFVQADRLVIVDPATTFQAEQRFDISHFRRMLTNGVNTQVFCMGEQSSVL